MLTRVTARPGFGVTPRRARKRSSFVTNKCGKDDGGWEIARRPPGAATSTASAQGQSAASEWSRGPPVRAAGGRPLGGWIHAPWFLQPERHMKPRGVLENICHSYTGQRPPTCSAVPPAPAQVHKPKAKSRAAHKSQGVDKRSAQAPAVSTLGSQGLCPRGWSLPFPHLERGRGCPPRHLACLPVPPT